MSLNLILLRCVLPNPSFVLFTLAVFYLVVLQGAAEARADVVANQHNLNPGVRAGDIVIMRRVEPAPIGSVDRHGGPIPAKVNTRDPGMEAQRNLTREGGILSLSDEQAAGVRSSALGTSGHLQGSGATTNSVALHSGRTTIRATNQVTGALGGGRGSGGIAGSVTSATSGIANTVGQALSPLTTGGQQ